jgi:hypothetical protein
MPWRQCCPSHAQGDPLQLQGPETFDPTLSCQKMPIRGHCLHFAVHHDRPISVFFLDRWQGREKLSREAVTIEGRSKSYILGYHRIRSSKGFRQTCISQVFSSLASQLACGQLAREGVARLRILALSTHPRASRQTGTFQGFPLSSVSAAKRAGTIQSADIQQAQAVL